MYKEALTAETRLLRVVSDQLQTFGLVLDDVGCYRRMVGYLFHEEIGLTALILVGPHSIEEPKEASRCISNGKGAWMNGGTPTLLELDLTA